jgi:hypothetical protein
VRLSSLAEGRGTSSPIVAECPHWGYLLSGRLEMRTKDGADVYEAGQAFY